MGAFVITVIFLAPAILGFGLLAIALARAAAQGDRMSAPPARPSQRRVDLDLSDVEWDWKREEAA